MSASANSNRGRGRRRDEPEADKSCSGLEMLEETVSGPGCVPPLDRLLLSIDSAADVLSLSRREMVRLLDEGEVESVKRGRRRLVVVRSLRSWVDVLAEDARA